MTRNVTYSLGATVDGYAMGPDGSFDWGDPDPEIFAFATDEVRALGFHLMGRKLYEAMLIWETADEDPAFDEPQQEFARIWKALPKVVFSNTLAAVEGNARLATEGLAEEIARLRSEPGEGNIAIGGATLAAAAAELDLIDEYRVRVHPVLVGGGTSYYPQGEQQRGLELVESRVFGNGQVTFQHYRVQRST